jgi:hypothetical protein
MESDGCFAQRSRNEFFAVGDLLFVAAQENEICAMFGHAPELNRLPKVGVIQ